MTLSLYLKYNFISSISFCISSFSIPTWGKFRDGVRAKPFMKANIFLLTDSLQTENLFRFYFIININAIIAIIHIYREKDKSVIEFSFRVKIKWDRNLINRTSKNLENKLRWWWALPYAYCSNDFL